MTEDNPPWPSNTAAKWKPSKPSELTRISSSISSLRPCRAVDPHRTPATPPVSDDGASIARAEQHGVLALVVVLLLVYFLGGLKLELQWFSFVKRNFCNCGVSSAIKLSLKHSVGCGFKVFGTVLVVREVVVVWFMWRIRENEGRPLTDLTDWIQDVVKITEASDFAKSDGTQYLVGPIQIHFLFVIFFFFWVFGKNENVLIEKITFSEIVLASNLSSQIATNFYPRIIFHE